MPESAHREFCRIVAMTPEDSELRMPANRLALSIAVSVVSAVIVSERGARTRL